MRGTPFVIALALALVASSAGCKKDSAYAPGKRDERPIGDQEIAKGFAVITEAIGQDGNLIKRLQKLVADRPGITQDQLMALFMEEFNQSFKTTLEKPIELAAQNAIKGLDVDKEANMLLAQ